MKRRKTCLVPVGLLLMLLGITWWLLIPDAQPAVPPRLSFVAFTNDVAGKRMAAFSISNAAHRPTLFAPIVEVQGSDGSYERWAAGPPEMAATPIAAGGARTFATTVPDLGSVWRLRVIWQPKPTKMERLYAAGLGGFRWVFGRTGYPAGWVPSARIWQNIVIAPEMLRASGAEPTALPNAAPPHR